MKVSSRLPLLMAAVAVSPALVLAFCSLFPGLHPVFAALVAAAAAALTAYLGWRAVTRGLVRPLEKVSAAAKVLAASDGKLDFALPKEGWPEGAGLISAMNRLMLELGAFRAFHLNQVVEDRAKAQALIETITDGVMLLDDKGQLIYSNQRALGLLGIPKQEEKVVLPASVRRPEFAAALAEMLPSGERSLKAEVELPGPDGAEGVARVYQVVIRHFLLTSLKKPGRVLVLRDITVEKEIESARETFFHMLTHDMRAPLASIQGYAQMLGQRLGQNLGGVPGDVDKILSVILRSSKRLNGMIGDILNTIKLERGEMELRPVQMEAGALCAGVFDVYDPLAVRKKIKFSFKLPNAKLEFNGDPVLLERVISNLVGNALKFTPAEGSVLLSSRAADGQAIFCVEDTGPGIPVNKQTEIFKKYAQMEEHKYMGFGLGLAMCNMAVELHKGRIWVESEEGKGARFYFSVPLQPEAPRP